MKKEQAIKVTVTRYYDPSEIDIDYYNLLESVGLGDGGFRITDNAKTWLRQNMKAVASYDKHCVDEGTIEIEDFLNVTDGDEDPEYLFEVVEFTTHDDGHVTEEVIHVCRDETFDLGELRDDLVVEGSGVAIEPRAFPYKEQAKTADPDEDAAFFYSQFGRFPSLLELMHMKEARASVALDKGDGSTWSVETRKPDA